MGLLWDELLWMRIEQPVCELVGYGLGWIGGRFCNWVVLFVYNPNWF